MNQWRFQARRPPLSLHWDGDELVDWVSGGTRWRSDGRRVDGRTRYAYAFDRAVVSPSGRYQVLYTELGTKGLVLDAGRPVREINRSFYHANNYEYPIALGRLPDGREVLIHCPDTYNKLEIEDLASGERLTERPGTGHDIFHSRLSLSPDGRRLLSGGWVWHPATVCEVYDLADAVVEPGLLDTRDGAAMPTVGTEVVSCCWLTDELLAVAAAIDEEPSDDEDDVPESLGSGGLGVWSVIAGEWRHRSSLDNCAGLLLPCDTAVLSLYDHPKLIDPASGQILSEWLDLNTGKREFPYYPAPMPPVAVHPSGDRFAVADRDGITVVALAS